MKIRVADYIAQFLVENNIDTLFSVVGGGAIAVVISLIISPLITILMYRLCLKLALIFASLISVDGCADVISSFLGAIDMLMAAYAFSAIVYIAELVAFLKGGVGYA